MGPASLTSVWGRVGEWHRIHVGEDGCVWRYTTQVAGPWTMCGVPTEGCWLQCYKKESVSGQLGSC